MNVAQNKVNLVKFDQDTSGVSSATVMSSQKILGSDDSVGFEPEIYRGGEEGFRVRRKEDGTPLKAAFEINQKTPEELERMNDEKVELKAGKNL